MSRMMMATRMMRARRKEGGRWQGTREVPIIRRWFNYDQLWMVCRQWLYDDEAAGRHDRCRGLLVGSPPSSSRRASWTRALVPPSTYRIVRAGILLDCSRSP